MAGTTIADEYDCPVAASTSLRTGARKIGLRVPERHRQTLLDADDRVCQMGRIPWPAVWLFSREPIDVALLRFPIVVEDFTMRRIAVRFSPVHGRGLFALTRIEEGARIIEYKGRRVSWESAEAVDHSHTFLFGLDNGQVVDGGQGGNSARWINHSCEPNAEVQQEEDRLFVVALRTIEAGTELSIDYNLEVDGRKTKAVKKLYECRCRAPACRGTMLQL